MTSVASVDLRVPRPRIRLPRPRGPVSAAVISALRGDPGPVATPSLSGVTDPLADDDLQLALYVCYELHYRGFDGVDPEWEWSPSLLAVRRQLELHFEAALVEAVGPPTDPGDVRDAVRAVAASGGGPSLSTHVLARGTLTEMQEFCIHRSAYQLKEADPHTWAIPRLSGAAKAAMVEIQADEYGGGDLAAMHAELFGRTMSALGLDPSYGAYLDRLPGTTLATVNLVSLLGLHRRWRGALVGHLALFEITSVVPMGRYSGALARLGFGEAARRFYDVHVVADAEHEVIALERMVGPFAEAEPELAGDVVFGARAVMHLEERLARSLLDAWSAGQSSLLSA